MHPLLATPRRLLPYLGAWALVAILLAYAFAAAAPVGNGRASALAVLLCLFGALLCLPAYFTCRVLPLQPATLSRAVGTHVAAAALAAGVWTAWMWALASGLGLARPLASAPVLRLVFGLGVLLYLMNVAGYYVGLSVAASREAEARLLETTVLAREAELRALKAQINPHFLFNSLNSISALTTADPARAREMCILLGDFLRRTLGLGELSAVPLAEELALVHAFLAVEKIRYGDRLAIEENVAEAALRAPVPPLLLQPLVENAVVHGIGSRVEGGTIRLQIDCADGRLTIRLENEFDPEAPPRRRSGGLGLENVRRRLARTFGPGAALDARAGAGLFQVALLLPLGPPVPEVRP